MHKKKKARKVLIGILCFFLGFLFAFIFEIGIILGGGYFIATRDIDKLMEFVGIPNRDEQGNNIYINTDEETGGAKTIKDLVTNIIDAVNDMSTLSVGKISGMVPATDLLIDMIFDMTGKYIDIDREKFESTPVAELPQFVVDSVMNIRGSAIMSLVSSDGGESNGILKALLSGAESEYATVSSGETASLYAAGAEPAGVRFPVLYDTYIKSGEIYTREWSVENVGAAYPTYPNNVKLSESWLQSDGTEEDGELQIEKYRLYFVPCRVTANGIEEAEYSGGKYEYTASDNSTKKTFKVLTFGEDTDFILVKPDGDGNFVLNYEDILASKNASATDSSDRFIGYSYKKEYAQKYYYVQEKKNLGSDITCMFKTISGLSYFYNFNNEMMDLRVHTLGDIMENPYEPLESVSIASVTGGSDGLTAKMFGKTSIADLLNGKIDFNKVIDDMEVSEFIREVAPENKLMANLIYKLSDLRDNGDGTYTGIYDIDGERKDAYVTVKNGFIDKVYLNSDRTTVLHSSTVGQLSETSNNIKLDKILNMEVGNAITRYLGYGITEVYKPDGEFPYSEEDAEREPYSYVGVYELGDGTDGGVDRRVCYVQTREKDGKEIIDRVWYYEDDEPVEIEAKAINDVNGRIDTIMDYICLPDVIEVSAEQAIMTYVAYSVTGVKKAGEIALTDRNGFSYLYTGKYTPEGSETPFECYISVKSGEDSSDQTDYVDKIWYYDLEGARQYVFGTRINKVAGSAEKLKKDMALGEIINISDDDERILVSLRDTKIEDLNVKISSLKLYEIFSEESIEESPMLRQLKNVSLTELADEIDNLLIQQMYSGEVYNLPADEDPMQVIDYSEDYLYYVVDEAEEEVEDGEGGTALRTVKKFVPVNGDGVLTLSDFENRGSAVYYTYGKSTLESEEGDKIKIAGFNERWLYFIRDEENEKFVLTDENVPEDATPTQRDDAQGNLLLSQYESGKYYSYGEARGMWRLVLYKRVSLGDNHLEAGLIEKAYSINNFNNMVAICAQNVYNATLSELVEANVISDVSAEDLNKTLPGQSKPLKDMSFKELIAAVIVLAS